jgi:malic enzyme
MCAFVYTCVHICASFCFLILTMFLFPCHQLSTNTHSVTLSLLGTARIDELNTEQKYFARTDDNGLSLLEVIQKYKPTMLLGVTTVGGLFTEEVIRTMAANCPRPIIFPLSNPTTKAECTAEQAYEWTDGKCIFASGSPFPPVIWKDQTYYPSQCNNMYIFPGLGLGATVCGAKKVTNRMLYVAAETLAQVVEQVDLDEGRLFPPLDDQRCVPRNRRRHCQGGLARRTGHTCFQGRCREYRELCIEKDVLSRVCPLG